MVKASHKSNNGGTNALFDRIKKLSSQKVCVGVPAEDTERDDSDLSNADLIYIHTHGVRPRPVRGEMQHEINKGTKYSTALQMYIHEHGSFAYQVPARPIIEPAIEDSKESISEQLGNTVKIAAAGENTENALNDVGQYASGKVKTWFTNSENGWAPNSESTIKKKKSDKPLIDSGALRQSITYVIRGDNE
jgi:hypothetical protein